MKALIISVKEAKWLSETLLCSLLELESPSPSSFNSRGYFSFSGWLLSSYLLKFKTDILSKYFHPNYFAKAVLRKEIKQWCSKN